MKQGLLRHMQMAGQIGRGYADAQHRPYPAAVW